MLTALLLLFNQYSPECQINSPRDLIQFLHEDEYDNVVLLKVNHSENINCIVLEYSNINVFLELSYAKAPINGTDVEFLTENLDTPVDRVWFSMEFGEQTTKECNNPLLKKLCLIRNGTVQDVLNVFQVNPCKVVVQSDYWITWMEKCFIFVLDEETFGEGFAGKSSDEVLAMIGNHKIRKIKIYFFTI